MPIVRVESISKRFGAVQALDSVCLDFDAGEVHGILGANGAGKSTLMGVLAGFVLPDTGQVLLNGQPVKLGDPLAMKRDGMRMVHQHFMLVPNFTVRENLAMGEFERLRGALDLEAATASAIDLAAKLGWNLPLDAITGELPVGVQQRIEVVRALAGNAQVLILDEPTAVLADEEVIELFTVLRRVAEQNTAVILIAHNLDELLSVADRITILRDGRVAESLARPDATREILQRAMEGEHPAVAPLKPARSDEIAVVADSIEAKGDRGEPSVQGVSFTIHRQEVFGIGGVDGNGQVELAEVAMGLRKPTRGSISSPQKKGYVPQDRQVDGLALSLSVRDNLFLGQRNRKEFAFGPFLRLKEIRRWAGEMVNTFDIKVAGIDAPANSLSGGNQQKIVVSRAVSDSPDFLVAVNPTRGLDIVATNFVRRQIEQVSSAGAATLLLSTDREDIAELANQSATMVSGRLQEDEH